MARSICAAFIHTAGFNIIPLLTGVACAIFAFVMIKVIKMKADGVEFASHIDGTRFFLGPRESMAIQRALGSDIVMSFDECTPYPCKYEDAAKSLDVTLRWELMSREQKLKDHQQLFGIVQGSTYRDLRERSAKELVKIGFDG